MTVNTCATCPLSRQIENERYECTSAHKQSLEVVRGHWKATDDCNHAIEQHRLSLEAALAVAEKEFENGRRTGWYDAKFKTCTVRETEQSEWLDGYYTGQQQYLASIISLPRENQVTYAEWKETVALIPAGWRLVDGWWCGKGGRYSQSPVELTERQANILAGLIKVR